MGRLSAKLRSQGGGRIGWWCPGCEAFHAVPVNTPDGRGWKWNGDVDRPTLQPSVLTTYEAKGEPKEICHVFIVDGIIDFLGDCTHHLAGQKVPIPDWPYAEGEYGGV